MIIKFYYTKISKTRSRFHGDLVKIFNVCKWSKFEIFLNYIVFTYYTITSAQSKNAPNKKQMSSSIIFYLHIQDDNKQ